MSINHVSKTSIRRNCHGRALKNMKTSGSFKKNCFILFLINSVSFVTTVYLHGGCPEVPDTQFYGELIYNLPRVYEILASIPFSPDRPSYLFLDINHTNRYHFDVRHGIYDTPEHRLELRVHQILHGTSYSEGFLEPEPHNKSLFLTSEVKGSDQGLLFNQTCYIPIKEEVWIWFRGEILIIWSCIDVDITFRDEAVMLGNGVQLEMEEEEYMQTIERYREIVSEYLSPELCELIDWPIAPAKLSEIDFFLFECPVEHKKNARVFYWCVGSVALCWLVIFLAVLLHKSTAVTPGKQP